MGVPNTYQGISIHGITANDGTPLYGATGVAAPPAGLVMAGQDGNGILRVFLTDPTGAIIVNSANNAARTYITLYIDAAPGIMVEDLESLVINSGGSAHTAAEYTVTAGKTFRIQSVSGCVQGTSTTIQTSKILIRVGATVSVASPVVFGTFISNSGLINSLGRFDQSFADGLEIAAGQQIGVSHVESTAQTNITVCIIGYEY